MMKTLTPIAALLALSVSGVALATEHAAPAAPAQAASEGHCGSHKAGEAKCGAKKAGEAKCGAHKSMKEGKCGEGKCGGKKKADAEAKCGAKK